MNKLMEFDLFFCVILPSSAPTPTQLGAELALTSISTPPTHPAAGKVILEYKQSSSLTLALSGLEPLPQLWIGVDNFN